MRISPRLAIIVIALACTFSASAQDSIIKWTATTEKISAATYRITVKGNIQPGWHVYTAADAENEITAISAAAADSGVSLSPLQVAPPANHFRSRLQ